MPVPSSTPTPDARRVFKVHACIGRGGFGEVYLATMHRGSDRPVRVALKVLHAGVHPDSEPVRRLRDERLLLGALEHRCILRAHDLAVVDDRVALVTEYVDGEDLSSCLAAGPLPPCAALEIGGLVADALHTAAVARMPDGRPLDLVHRDVKPSNVRLARNGAVKLLDFGVARAEGVDREARTGTDIVLGSLPYMAPELIRASGAGHPSDVYALAVTVYEALVGERLLRLREPELIGLLLHDARFEEHVDERLERIDLPDVRDGLRRMVAWDPEDRPRLEECVALYRSLAHGKGPGVDGWCRTRQWKASPVFAGVLSGRVLHEQLIDPHSVAHHTGDPAIAPDPDSQAVTVLADGDDGLPSDTISREGARPTSAPVLEARPRAPAPVSTLDRPPPTALARVGRVGAFGVFGLGAILLVLGVFALVFAITMVYLRGMT